MIPIAAIITQQNGRGITSTYTVYCFLRRDALTGCCL